jgi:hypothetical protein
VTRDEVFTALIAKGAAKAVIEFHGGGDEGFTDEFFLEDSEGNSIEDIEKGQDDLATALYQPVEDRFGGFDGLSDVQGTLTWNVAERKVTISGSETEWVDFEEEVKAANG